MDIKELRQVVLDNVRGMQRFSNDDTTGYYILQN